MEDKKSTKCEHSDTQLEIDDANLGINAFSLVTGNQGDASDQSCAGNAGCSDEISIADMILQTVSNHFWENNLPGFVFNEEYQMYYNSESGYYYDQNSSLFYHPSTRSYYFYDENAASFVFHSRPPEEHNWGSKKALKHAISLFGNSYESGMSQDEVDVFECVFDVINILLHDAEDEDVATSSSDDEIKQFIEEERIEYPPCIRLTGTGGNIDLHIITIAGASISFTDECDIRLDDLGVEAEVSSKEIARVKYMDTERTFVITSLVQNYTCRLNGDLMSVGEPYVLQHGDICGFDKKSYALHIHHGSNTCNGCEPGLAVSSANTSSLTCGYQRVPSEVLRRRNLKALKAEYGLLGDDASRSLEASRFVPYRSGHRYRGNRRKAPEHESPMSSDPTYSCCEAKPVPGKTADSVVLRSLPAATRELDQTNKGYQLLRGLGWKEGTGLGKDATGIVHPIASELRPARMGLGATPTDADVLPKEKSEKLRILEITKKRFESL